LTATDGWSCPYRRDRSITDDVIAAIARKTYLDDQPWPFDALTR
jgi:hypothetical protein